MSDLKVSCIIPLYNDEKYISRCINSLVLQTYKNIEILIINDGSTDKSLEICQFFEKKDSRIKIITVENRGVCNARNIGVAKFSGEYAVFVDSDDFLEIETIENLVKIVNDYNNVDLVVFDYNRVLLNGVVENKFNNSGKISLFTGREASKLYLNKDKRFSMVLWRRLYKKELLKKVKFEDNMLPEDLATAFYIYSSAQKIIHIEKSYYNYFIKEDGLSFQNKLQDQKNLFNIISKLTVDEIVFFEEEDIKKYIKNIYFNYLLTIYSKTYFIKNSVEKKEFLRELKNKIEENYLKGFDLKTKVAYTVFKLNKYFFSQIMNVKNYINIRKR